MYVCIYVYIYVSMYVCMYVSCMHAFGHLVWRIFSISQKRVLFAAYNNDAC